MTPDAYFLRAMHDLYRSVPHLTAIEQVALLPIRYAWEDADPHDTRWVAAVGELREDGAAVAVPLTLDRLDRYCLDYERTGKTTPFSLDPERVR